VTSSARRVRVDQASPLKGRIAEAFVEAIFRRAGYTVSRIGRESQVQRLIKIGTDEFLPDFLVRKPVGREKSDRPLHRLVPVEAKYRRDVTGFLRRYGKELFGRVSPHWPDLCFVFVTDSPEAGRSCFQLLDLWHRDGFEPRDLETVADLDIFATTVREYEALVLQIFPLLDQRNISVGGRSSTEEPEKPASAGTK
jgi:hypothetical protein